MALFFPTSLTKPEGGVLDVTLGRVDQLVMQKEKGCNGCLHLWGELSRGFLGAFHVWIFCNTLVHPAEC